MQSIPVLRVLGNSPGSGGGSGDINTMSDIMFLAKKEFDGKLRTDEGFISGTGDLATLTANTGKDMYIARAKVTFYHNDTGVGGAVGDKVELKINGVTVETAPFSWSNDGPRTLDYEFKNIGHRVTTGQIIKLEVTVLNVDTDVEGFIECWEEDTGVTPVI